MKTVGVLSGLFVFAAFAVAVVACVGGGGALEQASSSGGSSSGGSSSGASSSGEPEQPPRPEGTITVPPSLTLRASFVAASLADDCGGSAGRFSGDCAPAVDGGGSCGGFCQQTNVQIGLAASGGGSATIEIAAVTLHDANGVEVDRLTSRNPQVWSGNAYKAWDQTIASGAELKVTYDLSAPSWSKISSTAGTQSSTAKYRMRVQIKVSGQTFTIESPELSREPMVAT